jgi:hypothetical protein
MLLFLKPKGGIFIPPISYPLPEYTTYFHVQNRKRIHIIDLQQTFDLISGDYSASPESSHRHAVLHFYPNGIRAELVTVVYEEPVDNSA